MIGAFPELHPDELLYSGFARYRAMFGFHAKALRLDLFGTAAVTAVIDLPGHLDAFVERLPPGHPYSTDRLIRDHTMLPYYIPFLPPHRLTLARDIMRGRGGRSRGAHRILNAAGVAVATPASLQFCRRCVEEDSATRGVAYWRRTHQAPGVLVCPMHGGALHESTVERRLRSNRYDYHALGDDIVANGRALPLPDGGMEHLRQIALDTQWVLAHERAFDRPQALGARYRHYARACGWVDRTGRLQCKALEEAVGRYYGATLLDMLGLPVHNWGTGATWVTRLLQSPHRFHPPLRHFVVWRFLGVSAAACLADDTGRRDGASSTAGPFASDGPRPSDAPRGPGDMTLSGPCRNPCCQRFDEQGVAALRAPVGAPTMVTVCCPTCQFSYAFSANRPTVYAVRSVGPVWEAAFRQMANDGTKTQREMAASLGMQAATLMRIARVLGITPPAWEGPNRNKGRQWSGERRQAYVEATRPARRAAFLTLRRAHPVAMRKDLERRGPSLYHWLQRNDRAWHEQHLPLQRTRMSPTQRFDWAARDAELADKIAAAALAVRNVSGRPVRITIRSIEVRLGRVGRVRPNLDRLPRTRAMIEQSLETRDEFAARRLAWAAGECARERMSPTPGMIARRAGFGSIADARRIADVDQLCELARDTVLE